MSNVTPETNAARILAEALAKNMSNGLDGNAPPVEEIAPATAQFAIDTPFGRVRVDVTMIEADSL